MGASTFPGGDCIIRSEGLFSSHLNVSHGNSPARTDQFSRAAEKAQRQPCDTHHTLEMM
jgi:hypothetical protein